MDDSTLHDAGGVRSMTNRRRGVDRTLLALRAGGKRSSSNIESNIYFKYSIRRWMSMLTLW